MSRPKAGLLGDSRALFAVVVSLGVLIMVGFTSQESGDWQCNAWDPLSYDCCECWYDISEDEMQCVETWLPKSIRCQGDGIFCWEEGQCSPH